jgi:AcrR family transcriptional regulator
VASAGADLADESGLDQLSMGLLADRLGVRTPSLYKHVDNIADLTHRIGVLAMDELADAIGAAIQGRSRSDALVAAAQTMRRFVNEHPGRYAAGNAARPTGSDDPLVPAARRVLDSLAAALRGYELDGEDQVHALRMLRSVLHGFATLEESGGFMIDTSVDESSDWVISLIDDGLRAAGQRTPT